MSNIHGLNNTKDKTNDSGNISQMFSNNLTNEPQLNLPTAGEVVFYKHYFIFFVFTHSAFILDGCKPNE
jgi:hypothetical protein